MMISARATYSALCKQLGVTEIPGFSAVAGRAGPEHVIIELRNVTVDDDEAREALIERGHWDDEPALADDPAALRDFIYALLAGDVGLARILGDRVFAHEAMRLACEDALVSAPAARRAA